MSHTPGPWRLDDRYHGCVLAGGTQVAAATMNGFLSAEERDANARLIAASATALQLNAWPGEKSVLSNGMWTV